MPHECTDCNRTFADGSKEMLSGCPECGGNTFQFKPAGQEEGPTESDAPDPPEPPEPAVDSSVARTVGNAATAVRDLVGSSESPSDTGVDPPAQQPSKSSTPASRSPSTSGGPESPSTGASTPETEDDAQASARSDIVEPDELPPSPEHPAIDGESETSQQSPAGRSSSATDGTPNRPDSGDDDVDKSERPDLSQLREELNEQFESIRVLNPGQYELNLMELYNREEYIIALQEDGKYTIQVPERWEEE